MIRLVLFSFLFISLNTYAQIQLTKPLATKIEQALSEEVDRGFSGAVLIAVADSIHLVRGFGYTDPTKAFSIEPTTLFNIASISKSFTAMGILLLREQGLLRLEDRIGLYFDEVPANKKEITIHQLLSHQSGLAQNYVTDGVNKRSKAIQKILADKLAFTPGTSFSYSNANFELLTAIIEVLTKSSYEDFIRKNILQVAGLKNTHFWGEVDDLNTATTAQKLERLSKKTRARNWGYLGSGGIYSSALDLFAFYQAVKSNQILNAESTALMLEAHHTLKSGTTIGYGWFGYPTKWESPEHWTRGNESFGHNAVLRWFPKEELLIIVCANTGERGNPTQTDNRIVSDALLKVIFESAK